jgi:hypothetical protein
MDYKVDAMSVLNNNVSNANIRDIRIREGNPMEYNSSGESTLVASVVYDVAGEGTSVYTFTVDSTNLLTEETPI